MTYKSCSVAVPVFGAKGTVAAGFGVVVHSINHNLSHFVPDLRKLADGIGEEMNLRRCDPYPGFQHDLPMLPEEEQG